MKAKPTRKANLLELSGFDVLTDVLATSGLQSRLLCRSELGKPWSIELFTADLAHFHIVERGSAWLEMEGQELPLALSKGDLLVITGSNKYRLVDQPGRKDSPPGPVPTDIDPFGRFNLIRQGGGAPKSILLCGSFSFDRTKSERIFALLPPILHLPAQTSKFALSIEPLTRLLITEVAAMRPGNNLVVSRVTDILFMQVLRVWLAQQPNSPSWLRALNDPRIGPALALIHREPGRSWSVVSLGKHVGLSRSAFTVHFTHIVGEPPQTYLTRVRMERAARMLRERRDTLAEIASAVGYESESSFNKAFRRIYEQTPGAYRRKASEVITSR